MNTKQLEISFLKTKKCNGFENFTDTQLYNYIQDVNNWCFIKSDGNDYENRFDSHYTLLHPQTRKHISKWKVNYLLNYFKLSTNVIIGNTKCDLGLWKKSYQYIEESKFKKSKCICKIYMTNNQIRKYFNNLNESWYRPNDNELCKIYYRDKEIETIKRKYFENDYQSKIVFKDNTT